MLSVGRSGDDCCCKCDWDYITTSTLCSIISIHMNNGNVDIGISAVVEMGDNKVGTVCSSLQ